MKKLSIGKQEFKKLIEKDCLYVDKTEYLISMIDGDMPTFLSRPRRFGKSLIINTIKELFSGAQELFKDTYAYDNWDFSKVHSVLRLDMSTVKAGNGDILNKSLLRLVHKLARGQNIVLDEDSDSAYAFEDLICELGKKSKIVILIDEYDTPILQNLYNSELPNIKRILREFYLILKSNESYIRFLFVTGISKFSQVSIFSALNHLDDITLKHKYGAIAGYTTEEIKHYFSDRIDIVKKKRNLTDQQFWEKLQRYYNGYSWDGETFVYNPLSILKFFDTEGDFRPYWMATGSPSFIVNYAKDKKFNVTDFEQIEAASTFLDRRDIDEDTPESFLTQAGYLTIKKYDTADDGVYTLDFPNHEVRYSFCELILTNQYSITDSDILGVRRGLQKALTNNSIDEIITQFKTVYSSIPYVHFDSNKTEHFYSAMLLMYLQATGFDTHPERLSNKGRLDLSLHYENKVYIFELKVGASPKAAIKQIIKNNYAGAYTNRKVILVGIEVSFEERNIVKYESERI